MNNQNYDRIEILITRHIRGECSRDEVKEVQDWLGQSSDNKALYDHFKKVDDLTVAHLKGLEVAPESINVDKEWKAFQETISELESSKSHRIGSSQGFLLKIAATIMLLFIVGYGLIYFLEPDSGIVISSSDNTLTEVLPDNSIITLNINSELSYNEGFNNELREVYLEGEAFFEVRSDPNKPFIIYANNTRIEVIGTSFSIRTSHSSEVEVIVQSGIVAFSNPESGEEVTLEAGERAIFTGENKVMEVSENTDVNFLSWKTRLITFEETSLKDVASTLSKVYGMEIELPDNIDCEITVSFDSQSIESVMKVLEATLDLTYSINGNKIIISAAGC